MFLRLSVPPEMSLNTPLLNAQDIEHLIMTAQASVGAVTYRDVHGHRAGDWPGTRLGQGLDFEESRPYSPSDAVKDMDWRSTARLGQAYVKTYREERQPMAVIVIDRTSSMRFGSRIRLKLTQAARAAIWLGTQVLAQGAALTLVHWDEQDDWHGPFHGQEQWLAAIERLRAPAPPISSSGLDSARDERRLQQLAEETPMGARVVLLSDFLWMSEAHQHSAALLANERQVCALRISDPLERAFEPSPWVSLAGRTAGATYWVNRHTSPWGDQLSQVISRRRDQQRIWLEHVGIQLTDLCSTQSDLSVLSKLPFGGFGS